MPNNVIFLFFIGFLMGVFNFFGLKWTINRAIKMKNIALIIQSLIIRMAIVCIVFFIFLDKNWKNAAIMIIGFISVKYLVILSDKIKIRKK
ncbi:MAG: ATP synthase subunit I [Rickettsiales bacterium]|nr:ATP synthase subunit I [Rickettsiales bacterium]